MKKLVIFGFLVFAAGLAHGAPVVVSDVNGIVFAKWRLNSTGAVFMTDAERDTYIASKNVFSSSGSVMTTGDFSDIRPSADQIALATTTYNANLAADGLTITGANIPNDEIMNRITTKAAALDLAVSIVLDLRACQDIQSNTGLSLAQRIARDRSILEFIRRLWPTLQ